MFKRIKNRVNTFLENQFNINIIGRKIFEILNREHYLSDNNYWDKISLKIRRAAETRNKKYFFRNWAVILHLASEDWSVGYEFVNKIKNHKLGEELLNKCQTPPWGSPFLMKKFPFLSPTTASHLVNIISIYDAFGDELKKYKNIVDFGGGYGGLARCLLQITKITKINIVDLEKMLEVQKKYITETSNFEKRIFFFKNVNLLKNNYCLFNASFSFSEISLIDRKNIENFILNKCIRFHIIYQDEFNNVDNQKYMSEFATKLKAKKWQVFFKPYGHGSSSNLVFFGMRKNS